MSTAEGLGKKKHPLGASAVGAEEGAHIAGVRGK